eukprot:9755427-Heterocapsa_arctica.AAC.1
MILSVGVACFTYLSASAARGPHAPGLATVRMWFKRFALAKVRVHRPACLQHQASQAWDSGKPDSQHAAVSVQRNMRARPDGRPIRFVGHLISLGRHPPLHPPTLSTYALHICV